MIAHRTLSPLLQTLTPWLSQSLFGSRSVGDDSERKNLSISTGWTGRIGHLLIRLATWLSTWFRFVPDFLAKIPWFLAFWSGLLTPVFVLLALWSNGFWWISSGALDARTLLSFPAPDSRLLTPDFVGCRILVIFNYAALTRPVVGRNSCLLGRD